MSSMTLEELKMEEVHKRFILKVTNVEESKMNTR